MALVQSLLTSDRYSIKCPYAMTAKGICIHNTANDASAKNEISYMKTNNNEVSFHIAIDDVEAIQGIPFDRNAWAAGDGGSGNGNRNYIHIEICYSKSGGVKFVEAEKRSAKEVAALLKKHGWGISAVKKHQDFSNKYCPHRTLDMGWQRFLNMIQAELNGSVTPPVGDEMYRVRKTWADAASQIGAYSNLDNAKALCDKKPGYSVFNKAGTKVYPVVVIPTPPSQSKRYLNLKPHMAKWAVYNQNGPYTSANKIGEVLPKNYGGLSYEILGEKGNDVYIISTDSYGKCAMWAPKDNDSTITSSPAYNNSNTSAPSNKQYLNLKPHNATWSVYKENGPYTSAYAIGKLAPAQYGGISYEILASKGNDVYVISTGSFGRCGIWVPKDNDSSFTSYPVY